MALMNALTSAVTGINSEQSGLDVVANNISNVNTPGYKSQTVTFSDLLSQTISAASGATATTGGVNAQQIGMGTSVGSTETDMTVGTSSTTSNSTDVALTGAGYLIVQTGTKGDYEFTRNGSLSIDANGNMNVNGSEVCGWEAYTLDTSGNKVYTTNGTVEPINVYSDDYANNKKVMAATTTTASTITGNVKPTSTVVSGATLKNIGTTTITTPDATTTIDVVDEQGNKTAVTINLKKCATDNTTTSWYWTASATDTTISPSSGYIAFDSAGNMVTSVTPLTAKTTNGAALSTDINTSTQTTLAAAITAATTGTASTNKTAVVTAYDNYTAALTAGGKTSATAATLVSTKTALDAAISTLADSTLSTALTAYNSAGGTTINAAAIAEAASDSTSNESAVTDAITAAAATTTAAAEATLSSAIFTATAAATGDTTAITSKKAAVSTAYTAYAAAITRGDAATIVSTMTALATAASALDTINGNTTLTDAITTYNATAGTTINAAATAAATNTTGYTDSSMTASTGLTTGKYSVNVAASTSSGTYNITLTDPAGKTYTTTSTTGAATFTTSSGTVTLAAPTTLAAGTVEFTVAGDSTLTFDAKPALTVTSTTAGTNAVPVTLDLSKITSTGTTSSLSDDTDGNVAGTSTGSYTIAKDGTISVKYSNGLTQSVGQIALAVFENASGLEKAGGNLYTASTSSGSYNTVVAGENGSGTMTSYALELSNVDLASQFSQMMICQRAYQANTKVISTGSEMLQSLISMVS